MDEWMLLLLSPEIILGTIIVIKDLVTGVIKILESNK